VPPEIFPDTAVLQRGWGTILRRNELRPEGDFRMGRLSRLLREITPAWLMQPEQRQAQPGEVVQFRPRGRPLSARDADKVWRDHIEKGLFGAETSDFTDVPEQRAERLSSKGEADPNLGSKH
jgi:hypothetical protein